jgi:hydroxymethylpyrimidine pyrophosphatase-like HAD family hydrolase
LPDFFHAIATDYDGTLTENERPSADVLAAVHEARQAGQRVLLVTGRILSELQAVFPDAEEHFDAIVAENGAVVSLEGSPHLLSAPVPFELDRALVERGVTFRRGQVLLATRAEHDLVATEEIRRLHLECQLVRNRNELMILPSGISKGVGVFHALGELGVSRHNTIAVGDAENDHSLLASCELGVAVANAVEALKRNADLVLERPSGEGVIELLRGPLLRGEVRIQPRRWQVEVGRCLDGTRATLPASQLNLLVVGPSKSGKSFVAGVLAERLIGLGYSVCIIDPEGDYAALGRLRGALVVGGHEGLPMSSDVGRLLRYRFGSLIFDLSMMDPVSREPSMRELLRQLDQQRSATGLPHWLFVDEAHVSFGGSPSGSDLVDLSRKGHCLITYRPEDLGPAVWEEIDAALVLPVGRECVPEEGAGVTALMEERAGLKLGDALKGAHFGQAVLVRREDPAAPRVFDIARRTSVHVRHWHKYVRSTLAPQLHFTFRSSDGQARHVARNLEEFHRVLAVCDAEVLRYHAGRHDLSLWIRDAIRDLRFAEAVRDLEDEFLACGSGDEQLKLFRGELLRRLEHRYIE